MLYSVNIKASRFQKETFTAMQAGARPYNVLELQNDIKLILKYHPLQKREDREFLAKVRHFMDYDCTSDTIYFTAQEEERLHDLLCDTIAAEDWAKSPTRGKPLFEPCRNWWMITSDTAH